MRERILTSEQVASILQVHQFTVLKYIKQGKLKGSKLGRMYRIRESDVEAFLNKHTAQDKESAPSKERNTSSPKTSPTASATPQTENAAHSEQPANPSDPAADQHSSRTTILPNSDSVDKDFILE